MKEFKEFKDTLNKHWAFFTNLFVTYGFSILFICFICKKTATQTATLSLSEIMAVSIDTVVPTTVVYVLLCIVFNLEDMLQTVAGVPKGYKCNLTTLCLVAAYCLLYGLYMLGVFTYMWFVLELFFTLLLICFNYKSYMETHISVTRQQRSIV